MIFKIMVKFAKKLEGELVPESKEAFVDYWQLKKYVKKIYLLSENISKHQESSLTTTLFSSLRKLFSSFGPQHREHETIHVHKKVAPSASKGVLYKTELLEQFADTDATSEFFACLDLQLNKVNQFYATKETECLDRGELLKKQMQILIELKTTLRKQCGTLSATYQDSKEDDSISGTTSFDEESPRERKEQETVEDNTPNELENSIRMKGDDGKMNGPQGRTVNFQGKKLTIHIPFESLDS